jgi:two-component system sensor histidine kinase RegB
MMVTSTRRPEFAPRIALPWIVRLRYAMVVGQIVTALVVHYFLKIDLPIGWIAPVPLLVFASNLWLARWVARPDLPSRFRISTVVSWIFVLDTICLTVLLMLSGGAANPFSLLYFVHITLAATILTKNQTWFLGALSTLGFGLLFRFYRPVPVLEIHRHPENPNVHLLGMWISFTIAVFLVAMFSAKISELLREREESLLEMQEELAKKDRLASLVTLAAGAAHELGTPLGTIAVVAKELELYATRTIRSASVAEDSRLIRKEVDRCREILQRMSVQGAEPGGEAVETVAVEELLDSLRAEFSEPLRSRIRILRPPALPILAIPRHAVLQALAALVKNALEASEDASEPDSAVDVTVRLAGASIRFMVTDHGRGIPPEMLRRIGEPFFTTKEPGKGMGLGTFLVRSLAERLGGRLTIESVPESGTTAVLELPLALKPEMVL